jgi:hypothetical protein
MGVNEVTKKEENYCTASTTSPGTVGDSSKPPYVIGVANNQMKPNTQFKLRIAGLQNPRYVISWTASASNQAERDAMKWKIETYGQAGSWQDVSAEDQMDLGEGGHVDVDKPTPITSFSAEAKNAMNGVATTYYLTWSTVLRTLKGDKFFVAFPPETELIPAGGAGDDLACVGINGFSANGL